MTTSEVVEAVIHQRGDAAIVTDPAPSPARCTRATTSPPYLYPTRARPAVDWPDAAAFRHETQRRAASPSL